MPNPSYPHKTAQKNAILYKKELPRWLRGKESACNAGDQSSIPGSGRSPGEGNDYTLQYSYLGNPMDTEAW